MTLRTLLLAGMLATSLALAADAPAPWTVDTAESAIRFRATQAGARFEGGFERFEAEVRFDPAAREASSADVRIATASVATGNGDRDDTLRSADFFAVDRFPEARYRAERFEALGDGRFRADGALTIRDVTRPVALEFTAERVPSGGWQLEGEAAVSRLAFELGATGDWRNTTWVGDDVSIRVRVVAD